jgi:hypothetical protein
VLQQQGPDPAGLHHAPGHTEQRLAPEGTEGHIARSGRAQQRLLLRDGAGAEEAQVAVVHRKLAVQGGHQRRVAIVQLPHPDDRPLGVQRPHRRAVDRWPGPSGRSRR